MATVDTQVSAETLAFTIPGRAVPQGSKDPKGSGRMVESGGTRLKMWRATVAYLARQHAREAGWKTVDGLPVGIRYVFKFRRGNNQYVGRKRDNPLLDDAPIHFHLYTPDSDKLQRAMNDAMKDGGLISDDSIVQPLAAPKVWTHGESCVDVTMRVLEEHWGDQET